MDTALEFAKRFSGKSLHPVFEDELTEAEQLLQFDL